MRDLKLNLTLSLLNAQLIKNKELLLHGQLIHHDVDICILTETWLSDNDSDRTWLQYTVLNKVPYLMFTSNRPGRKGGGMALIAKSHLRVKQIGGQLRSFQFCKWQVQVHHTSITLVSIYHVPYNNKTKVTNAEFWMNTQIGLLRLQQIRRTQSSVVITICMSIIQMMKMQPVSWKQMEH